MDYKTEAFEAIRRKDAVIWIGAGFSIYGGYSTGAGLSEQLYNKLTEKEKDGLNKYDLQAVSQAYVDFQKPNIFDDLKSEFHKKSKNNHYHLKLAKITHINTIITTIYDRMLEEAYGVNCQLIYKDDQISSIDNNKIQILKIHGDLQDENSIVLTKDHYTKFFNHKIHSNLWSVLKERFITKTQIFIGYGLEDINVNSFIDDMWSKSENRKDCFFVAPQISHHKIVNLKNKGVKYINLTGEQFIKELELNINANILTDFKGQKIDSDTFNLYMSSHKMFPNLISTGKNLELKSIRLGSEGIGKLTFTTDEETALKFEKMNIGESFDSIKIPSEKAAIFFEDVNLSNYENGGFIEIKSQPLINSTCDIIVENESFEIIDIPYQLFQSNNLRQVNFELKCGRISLKFSKNFNKNNKPIVKVEIKTVHNDTFKNTKDELEYYSLLHHICIGSTIQIDLKNGEIIPFTNQSKQIDQSFINNTLYYLNYIQELIIIEKFYKIKFRDFKFESIDIESKNAVRVICNKINNKFSEIIVDYEFELCIDNLTKELIEIIKAKKIINKEVFDNNTSKISIHNREIELGYAKFLFKNLIATNDDELKIGKDVKVSFRSKYGKAKISFLDNELEKIKNIKINN